MNLGELTKEFKIFIQDPTIDSSLTFWFNDEMLQLAMQYELPKLKLKTPASLVTTEADWQYDLVDDVTHASNYVFQKNLLRVTNSAHDRGMPIHSEIETIDRIDPDHDDTANDVDRVAIEDTTIAIYPKANDTLSLWFYRKPVDMADDSDEPDGLDEAWHQRVLIPRVVLRAMRVYPDLALANDSDNTRALLYWQNQLKIGLYGDGYSIGLIHALKKGTARPKMRGPSSGSNLSGSDRSVTRSSW